MPELEIARALIDLVIRLIGLTQAKELLDDLHAVQLANEKADRIENERFGA